MAVGTLRGPLMFRQAICHRADELEVSNEFRWMVNIDDVVEPNAKGLVRFPAIAIPVDQKNEFECPSPHLEALNDVLPQASKVLVVGWRGTEQHFLRILKDKLGAAPRPILVVAESIEAAMVTSRNLLSAGLNTLPSG